ncbi:MAG: hypothetical protein IKG22_11630, partial [Atopobiaceae bacterium]|nr:hypothetical protein [Atopobiaceae bacterium]
RLKKELWDAANNPRKVSTNLLTESCVDDYVVGGDVVFVIRVPRAPRELRPVFINDDLMRGTFKRNWEGDYHCAPREVKAMLRDTGEESPDAKELGSPYAVDEFDTDSVREYRFRYDARHPASAWSALGDEAFLQRVGAAWVDGDGTVRPTRAGLLMFGQEWRIFHEWPDYFLDYREHMDPRIRWTDRIQSQSGDWSGNVFDFYTRVSARLVRGLKVPFRLEGMVRQDETPAHDAVREALANCLVNADYHQAQSVVVEQWPDRLVLANPGTIICGKEQMLRGGISQPRNAGLFKMFNLIGVGEHAGSGVPDIFAAWDEAGYDAPTVEERFGADVPDRTTLTLPLVGPSLGTSLITGDQASDQASDQAGSAELLDMVCDFCSEPRTRAEIQRHLGISSRRYLRQSIIRPLLDSGRLLQTIPDKPSSPKQRYVRA